MASVSDNIAYYERYDWSCGGLEWSAPWGGTRSMWLHTLHPRIKHFIPARRIVEIGSGHGRISKILHAFTQKELVLYDILESCVDTCNQAFNSSQKTQCYLSDGLHMPELAEQSVDFVFSFYSLVGADKETLDSYIKEISRVLTPNGIAFIHHSNVGKYVQSVTPENSKSMALLSTYRDATVSAEVVRSLTEKHDLRCVSQECLNWDIKEALTDCFTVMARSHSNWPQKNNYSENYEFHLERNAALHSSKYRGSTIR